MSFLLLALLLAAPANAAKVRAKKAPVPATAIAANRPTWTYQGNFERFRSMSASAPGYPGHSRHSVFFFLRAFPTPSDTF